MYDDATEVGAKAASVAARVLGDAVGERRAPTWVLAGGTTPVAGHRAIVANHADAVDWRQVTYLIGDERFVPPNDAHSNWRRVREDLLDPLAVPASRWLTPDLRLSIEDGAVDYGKRLRQLPELSSGRPRLDHVWLGIGEDGHTLSLFPGHPSAEVRGTLVMPIYDAPKPPPARITLSLDALEGALTCLVLALGAGKADAVGRVFSGDDRLPIARAVAAIEANGGWVEWLLDKAAAAHL